MKQFYRNTSQVKQMDCPKCGLRNGHIWVGEGWQSLCCKQVKKIKKKKRKREPVEAKAPQVLDKETWDNHIVLFIGG